MTSKTSLARQLERLKVPQTLRSKEKKGKTSFLYDYLQASSIDNDTHFAIAVSGLQSLCQINPSFIKYNDGLFNESSKSLDRSLLTSTQNDELNQEIEEYLFRVVSPYFLLNATHKTLEWLIYRYHIQDYNTNSLISSLLPYHETRFFVRVIQMCANIKVSSSIWYWMKSVRKNGTPIPKSVLISHCISDLGFLRLVCSIMEIAIRIEPNSSAYTSFCTSILVGIIDRNINDENVLSEILSHIWSGLNGQNKQQTSGAYCVLSCLCLRVQLESKRLEKIIRRMIKKYQSELKDEFLMTLSIVINSQSINNLPSGIAECIAWRDIISFAGMHDIGLLKDIILKCNLDLLEVGSEEFNQLKYHMKSIDEKMDIDIDETPLQDEKEEPDETSKTVSLDEETIYLQLKSTSDSNQWHWHNELSKNSSIYELFHSLINNCSKSKKKKNKSKLALFVNKLIDSSNLGFLSALWSHHAKPFMQLVSIQLSINSTKQFGHLNELRMISLLIALTSPSYRIRAACIELMSSLAKYNVDHTLIESCLSNCDAIKNDANEISNTIASWIDGNDKSKSIVSSWMKFIKSDDTPNEIRVGLITLLNVTRDSVIVNEIAQYTSSILGKEDMHIHMKLVQALISHFNHSSKLNHGKTDAKKSESSEIVSAFLKCLQNSKSRPIILEILTLEYYKRISSQHTRMLILDQLLRTAVEGDLEVKKKLKKLINDGNEVNTVLGRLVFSRDALSRSPKKIKRQQDFTLESVEGKMTLIMLELILSKKELTNSTVLMSSLFEILNLLEINKIKSSLEYFRQLLLSSISKCLKQSDIEINAFQMQPIIKCLRESRQKETQRLAIMLINSVSSHFKKDVLQNMMQIFTFIGTNLVHCDDSYTLQVICDTMESIVSVLMLSSSTKEKESLIDMFIGALPDIPTHRQLPLFQHLLALLQEKTHLSVILLKIIESSIDKPKDNKEKLLDFAITLFFKSEIDIQIESVTDSMKVILTELTEERKLCLKRQFKMSDKYKKVKKESIASFILQVISSQKFIEVVAAHEWEAIGPYFETFFHTLMLTIEHSSNYANDKNMLKDFGNFYKRLRSIFYEILQKVNNLLPSKQMIELIGSLLKHESLLIQKKALEMLNDKLDQLIGERKHKEILQFIFLIDEFKSFIIKVQQQQENKFDNLYNAQIAMICLKKVCKNLTKDEMIDKYVEPSVTLLISVFEDATQNQTSNNFIASCLLCLSQLLVILNQNAIPFIPTVLPILINSFTLDKEVIIASLSAFWKISQNFSQFLSSDLDKIIIKLCQVKSENAKNIAITSKLESVYSNFSQHIPKRVLINAIDCAHHDIFSSTLEAQNELIHILKLSLQTIKPDEIKDILKPVKKLFFKLLDFRSLNCVDKSRSEIEKIEDNTISAIASFMPKLSEITFRPLFYKFYDWAIRNKDDKSQQRMITFYRMTSELAEKLRSLFCIFGAPCIVNNCVQTLNANVHMRNDEMEIENNINANVEHGILTAILTTLSKCFRYDVNGGFLNKDRTHLLMLPILNQLENTMGSEEDYQQRVNLIDECVRHLIQSAKDDIVTKDWNYQVLLKTRDNSPKVRFASLKVLHGIIITSSEEYLSLMSETMPFIAELNEDDCEEIEKYVQTIINDLEEILGEPISKFL